MKTGLLRTGSIPVQHLTRSDSGSLNQTRPIPSSPSISFRSQNNNINNGFGGIRRSSSDTNMVVSERSLSKVTRVGSISFANILEEESDIGFGNGNGKGNHNYNYNNNNYNYYNNNNNNNNNEKGKLKEHYLKLLKYNPCDSLILRNYAKYLHEVENNREKAEEYYGRAILASPGDGELLSLYGNLIWETQRDQPRARSYFDQALHSSPHDCAVLGSYAHFLWEIEDEDEGTKQENVVSPTMVGAY